MPRHPSLAGYAEDAAALISSYESRPFTVVFEPFLHVFPQTPCRLLDIGAGTGRHAAALARLGHKVVAVEPTRELREAGRVLHRDAPVTWVDDTLPELAALRGELAGPYDCVLMAAVMMHFDGGERERVMRRVAELAAPGGRFIATFRHGPVPPGRRMFEVGLDEAAALGARHGFSLVDHATGRDTANREGVSWLMLCMEKTTAQA